MLKYGNPPTLMEFCDVYIKAIDSLDGKVQYEQEKMNAIEESKERINREVQNLDKTKHPSKKQFILRVVELKGINCEEPLFDIQTDQGSSVTTELRDFIQADVILDLSSDAQMIRVSILHNNTNQMLFVFDIKIDDYLDKKRVENIAISQNDDNIEVFYEGQMIYERIDYLRELMRYNELKEEEFRENKFQLQEMKKNLEEIFPMQS